MLPVLFTQALVVYWWYTVTRMSHYSNNYSCNVGPTITPMHLIGMKPSTHYFCHNKASILPLLPGWKYMFIHYKTQEIVHCWQRHENKSETPSCWNTPKGNSKQTYLFPKSYFFTTNHYTMCQSVIHVEGKFSDFCLINQEERQITRFTSWLH